MAHEARNFSVEKWALIAQQAAQGAHHLVRARPIVDWQA
jgi:hypothetical protein